MAGMTAMSANKRRDEPWRWVDWLWLAALTAAGVTTMWYCITGRVA